MKLRHILWFIVIVFMGLSFACTCSAPEPMQIVETLVEPSPTIASTVTVVAATPTLHATAPSLPDPDVVITVDPGDNWLTELGLDEDDAVDAVNDLLENEEVQGWLDGIENPTLPSIEAVAGVTQNIFRQLYTHLEEAGALENAPALETVLEILTDERAVPFYLCMKPAIEQYQEAAAPDDADKVDAALDFAQALNSCVNQVNQ